MEQGQHEYENAQKVQKRLERETKKRERTRQEIDDLKNLLEKEKRRRIEAEDKLRTQKRIQSADLAAAANGEGASAGSIRKECIICFEREANQVSLTLAVEANVMSCVVDCRFYFHVAIRLHVQSALIDFRVALRAAGKSCAHVSCIFSDAMRCDAIKITLNLIARLVHN